jgi:hypothetical protein
MVADKVTDEMLTMPVGLLSDAEAAILAAALRGQFADEIITRIDNLRAADPETPLAEPVTEIGCTSTTHDRTTCDKAFANDEIREDEICPWCLSCMIGEMP